MGRIFVRYIDGQIKDDRRLINNVKYFPVIYNESDPFYTSRSERSRIWELIAQNLQSTAPVCEKRWEKLIELYRRTNLHDSLLEIMDQFLNVEPESTGNIAASQQFFCERNKVSDEHIYYTFTDSFFETEEALDFYHESAHSVY